MIIFITGGVKGGKSMFAQCAAKYLSKEQNTPLTYLATMIPYDSEDEKRISRHVDDRRDWGFTTVEEGLSFVENSEKIPENTTVLLDSVTAFVQNNMFFPDPATIRCSPEVLFDDIFSVIKKSANTILVSDYIFSDSIRYESSVYQYLETLGKLHCRIAECADTVIECCYSNMKFWKNDINYDFTKIDKEYKRYGSHLAYFDI